jgi:hypothetical protein
MPGFTKALIRDHYLSFPRLYFQTMYEVIYRPRQLLKGVADPVWIFLVKFLHPRMFLKETDDQAFEQSGIAEGICVK